MVGDVNMPALTLTGDVFLAGLDYKSVEVTPSPYVMSSSLRRGFVGCLQEVKIDGERKLMPY